MLRNRVATALVGIRFSEEDDSRVAEIVTRLIQAETASTLRRTLSAAGDTPAAADDPCAAGLTADAVDGGAPRDERLAKSKKPKSANRRRTK